MNKEPVIKLICSSSQCSLPEKTRVAVLPLRVGSHRNLCSPQGDIRNMCEEKCGFLVSFGSLWEEVGAVLDKQLLWGVQGA